MEKKSFNVFVEMKEILVASLSNKRSFASGVLMAAFQQLTG
jgi:hypothetical protein